MRSASWAKSAPREEETRCTRPMRRIGDSSPKRAMPYSEEGVSSWSAPSGMIVTPEPWATMRVTVDRVVATATGGWEP